VVDNVLVPHEHELRPYDASLRCSAQPLPLTITELIKRKLLRVLVCSNGISFYSLRERWMPLLTVSVPTKSGRFQNRSAGNGRLFRMVVVAHVANRRANPLSAQNGCAREFVRSQDILHGRRTDHLRWSRDGLSRLSYVAYLEPNSRVQPIRPII
jgi:hypothetical protein